MKMNKLAIILCLNLFALPSYAAQNKSNIIIDKPNATDPIVNGQNYGTNTIIGTVPTFSGSNNVILGSGNTATLNSTAIGENTTANDASTAVGTASFAQGKSLAIGTQSYSTNGSIAIGSQSVSTDGQVSVGSQYKQRRIENVAAGIASNDAVNVSQLNNKITPLQKNIADNTNSINETRTTTIKNTNSINQLSNIVNNHTTDINNNSNQITTNTSNIKTNAHHLDTIQAITKNDQKSIQKNEKSISSNTTAIQSNQQGIATNSARIDDLNNNYREYVNNKFDQLQGDIKQVRKHADAGIASAMAMTEITTPLNNFKYNVGMGVGGYGSQSAAALGAKIRINSDTTIGVTTSYDSQHNVGVAAGADWSFN